MTDALRRDEPKTFAAADDPWAVDRRLRAERDAHAAVVARRPPDRQGELEKAKAALARARDEHRWAGEGLALRQAERARLGPVTRLRRAGRDEVVRADEALPGAHRRLRRAGGRGRPASPARGAALRRGDARPRPSRSGAGPPASLGPAGQAGGRALPRAVDRPRPPAR